MDSVSNFSRFWSSINGGSEGFRYNSIQIYEWKSTVANKETSRDESAAWDCRGWSQLLSKMNSGERMDVVVERWTRRDGDSNCGMLRRSNMYWNNGEISLSKQISWRPCCCHDLCGMYAKKFGWVWMICREWDLKWLGYQQQYCIYNISRIHARLLRMSLSEWIDTSLWFKSMHFCHGFLGYYWTGFYVKDVEKQMNGCRWWWLSVRNSWNRWGVMRRVYCWW